MIRKVALVGSPNVGKSLIFNNLTRARATVSNYPGTTVTVSRGRTKFDNNEIEIVDTPGMYSLLCISEEERVARSILLNEVLDYVVHVLDSRNLARMLCLTFELIEADLPVIIVLNMMDEARAEGIAIDIATLQAELRVPVLATVATKGKGMGELKELICANSEKNLFAVS